MSKPVILTGLRANNDLHIGNYFGGLLPLIDMAKNRAEDYQINLFVPDLHSFTTPIDHSQLQAQILNNLRLFVAAGLPLDHADIHIYRQSYVPAHSELTWILDCFTGFGEMNRMTQFKDKSALSSESKRLILQGIVKAVNQAAEEGVSLPSAPVNYINRYYSTVVKELEESKAANSTIGLFNYPVLMACDILLYGAEYVPVGDDQSQHIEFTRDIGERMNTRFGGELFTLPKPVKEQHEFFGKEQGLRIKDLADPSKKMSKSDASAKGIIFLGDDPEEAAKKIMSATTDSNANIHFDFETQPGVSNLLQIQSLLRNQPLGETIRHWEGKSGYGDLKRQVAEAMRGFLVDFQQNLAKVDNAQLLTKLESDEFAMNEIANTTLARVQRAVGLRPKKVTSGRASTATKPQAINFDHFAKVDVRVGTVTAAERLKDSDKLIKLQVDLGDESRQILTGMQEFYAPEDFVGKQLPILVNLAPRTMMGEISQGMLLALEGQDGPVFLLPDKPLPNGSPLE